jgi:cellulose synthase/poly-beta-1,6-N-acetylglucosamine synthase-like glycosyltransferase
MIPLFKKDLGVVVGITRMTETGFFAGMQSLEWILSLSAMRFFSLWDVPFTGMGNNMAVSREAYVKIGGYEGIGFSIVEDYALYIAVIEKGYGFAQGFQKEITSVSIPIKSLSELLTQRKRWVQGAMSAPLPIKLSFFISALFLPLLFILYQWNPTAAGYVALMHYVLVTGISFTGARILRQTDLVKYLPFFWFYFNFNNTVMLINYLLPTPTIWKGRTYTS